MDTIEKWIHTPEGEVKADDPFKNIGSRFKYPKDPTFSNSVFEVTKRSIERTEKYHNNDGQKDIIYIDVVEGIYMGEYLSFYKKDLVLIS